MIWRTLLEGFKHVGAEHFLPICLVKALDERILIFMGSRPKKQNGHIEDGGRGDNVIVEGKCVAALEFGLLVSAFRQSAAACTE